MNRASCTKNQSTRTHGFTLIELIVVIAIISLLASIIMAGLSDSRVKAQNAAAIQQVREYQTAVGLYIINHQNRYPDVGDQDMHCIGSGSEACTWGPLGEVETESSGPLADLDAYIDSLPFVETRTVSGVGGTYYGLLYQCQDANCRTAKFYWPETNTTTCTKGTLHYTGTNGIICQELAEGVAN